MRKPSRKLSLHCESLLVLDAQGLAGATGATQGATCPTSCAPTCGNPAGMAHAAIAKTAPACCV